MSGTVNTVSVADYIVDATEGRPKDTPTKIVEKLNAEINAALADPVIKARFTDLAAQSWRAQPPISAKLIAAETEKWGEVIWGGVNDFHLRIRPMSERGHFQTKPDAASLPVYWSAPPA